jgi:RNA polymerase sigma-70 factor, ECF subfamily
LRPPDYRLIAILYDNRSELSITEIVMPAPSLPNDLVRRAQAADPQALTAIYEHYAPGIFRYIYYRIGDAELARDLQSEVFLRMLEGIERYEDRGWSIGSWLYRIAQARTIDALRRGRRRAHEQLDERHCVADGPEATLAASLESGALRQALGQLGEGQRRVLLLRHIYGLSLEETARQMGRSVGSVKALQHRAHARLGALVRAQLGEDAEG